MAKLTEIGADVETSGNGQSPAARRNSEDEAGVGIAVITQPSPTHLPAVFSPLARLILDSFTEGAVVFDPGGRVVYANHAAREALAGLGDLARESAATLLPRLGRLGGRIVRLRHGTLDLGEVVYFSERPDAPTLAERERRAILETLEANSWKLAEAARRLGISRTTLWRRLRAYGLDRQGQAPPTPTTPLPWRLPRRS